ncbi:cilia- and flagella-associated protein 52 isoform X2 [Homo sapiens]|uniref:cilia- and flagella-associated protein 52 isoform X2 n=1 Tax=Homo sapiens TaxID=9606 RepID=UPI001FB0A983|nr:cilia- and flagella-associated protein 52 isoform X2 [Homo sapiens]
MDNKISPEAQVAELELDAVIGFNDIILWDYKNRELLARLSLHKGKIEALAFSPNDLYLVSLGGPDDGSVVVWSIAKRDAICGSPAAGLNVGNATNVIFSRCRDEMFMTAGNGTIRVWELDLPNRKIWPTECQTGQLKRIVMSIGVDDDDSFFYLGTTTGDILKMNPRTKLLTDVGPAKDKFSLGVSAIRCLKMGGLLVGSGAGLLVFCKSPGYKPIKKIQLQGGITSITLRGEGHQFLVGTEESHIYRVSFTDFKETLIATCHFDAVEDIVFPFGTAELFATCAKKDIRVWHTSSNRELLRITVPNMTCHGIDFMRDGKSIISAWNDGKIRAFAPETGRLMYVINNAHRIGVTAIATTSDCKRVISGGGEGEVRVWQIGCQTQKLEEALKEHKSSVSCIRVKRNNEECVTASTDGTCIIWDLVRLRRNQMILANTLFQCVCYHPEEFQIITSGTDRKALSECSFLRNFHCLKAARGTGAAAKPRSVGLRGKEGWGIRPRRLPVSAAGAAPGRGRGGPALPWRGLVVPPDSRAGRGCPALGSASAPSPHTWPAGSRHQEP